MVYINIKRAGKRCMFGLIPIRRCVDWSGRVVAWLRIERRRKGRDWKREEMKTGEELYENTYLIRILWLFLFLMMLLLLLLCVICCLCGLKFEIRICDC